MEFNNIYSGLISGAEKLALVGLGYVGMPIAVEFAKNVKVIGVDINEKRVNEYRNGIDSTNEVGEAIRNTTVDFTADPKRLKEHGIPSMIYYPRGLHQQEAYRWMNLPDEWYPNTMEATGRILALPMHPYMTEETVDQIISVMTGA